MSMAPTPHPDHCMSMEDWEVQKKIDQMMPWTGLYITAASAVCTLAMAADAFNGLRRKKFWFPCKYFSLNALALTLLGVSVKLTHDMTTNLPKNLDTQFAKVFSVAFMSTAVANFMPSLGSMNAEELVANTVALGVLVITIVANGSTELIKLGELYLEIPKWIFITSMLLLLPTIVASAVSVPSIKRALELKYQEKHKVALTDDDKDTSQRGEALMKIDEQKQVMMKYWVMAETSNPQFVMARSVVCTTSVLILFLPTIVLVIFFSIDLVDYKDDYLELTSVYGGYTHWILAIQVFGAVLGSFAPICRWFVAVGFKCAATNLDSLKKVLKIENHWIRTLVELRDSSSSALHEHPRYLHDAKWLLLTFCIGIQKFLVRFSKLLVLVCAFISKLLVMVCVFIFSCFGVTKEFVMLRLFNRLASYTGNDESYANISRYVLLLDGEAALPPWVLKGIHRRAENTIWLGQKKQPMNLLSLLEKFDKKFNGVRQFDAGVKIPSLHSPEPLNCWTLSVVTLASIAIALPSIANHEKKLLTSSVSQGLSLVTVVDEALDKNAELANVRLAAHSSWVKVVFYKKWLDVDLKKTSRNNKNSKDVLQALSRSAKEIVESQTKKDSVIMENPQNWPAKVVAANSMDRISQTILLSFEMENAEALFQRLSVVIADVLAACLTNLAHVIATMCHDSAIEKREERVHEAFLLLGKAQKIIELLQQRVERWPFWGHDKAAYNIGEWPETQTSSNETVDVPVSDEESLAIAFDA